MDFRTPQASFKTFYSAMSDYSKGLQTTDPKLKLRLLDAIEVLEPFVIKDSLTTVADLKEASRTLKEVIDRQLDPLNPTFEGLRLSNTNIFFKKIGEWHYISTYSIQRAPIDFLALSKKDYLKSIKYPGTNHKKTWAEQVFPNGNMVRYLGVTQIQWMLMMLSLIGAFVLYYISNWIVGLLRTNICGEDTFADSMTLAITKPFSILLVAMFLKTASLQMRLVGNLEFLWESLTQVLISVSVFWLLYCLIVPMEKVLLKGAARTESELDDNLVPLLSKTLKVVIIVFAVLTTIQDLGINVFSLVAGLGVGGLAIALAAKDTAANFFGSLMILFDQPFKKGDWIKIDNLEGTVEEIGFRSTRIRTFYDSQIVVPNAKVASGDIDNLGRRQYRRTVEKLGLTYDTPSEKLNQFIDGLKKIINDHPLTRKDKHYISFDKFGDSSLEILLYFFLKVSDYKDELIAKEEIYISIKKLAQEIGVDFAFPSQSLYIEKSDPDSPKELNA